MKYVVMKGEDKIPGFAACSYLFFDVLELDPELNSKQIYNQLRKYSWRQFRNLNGTNPWRFRHETFHRTKNITLHNGKVLIKNVNVFQSEMTGTFFLFIPQKQLGF